MIGVGGIGSGRFFAVEGNHTLGREESRGGRFLDRRDYCKLHIISHYVRALAGEGFAVIPVGKVGNDDEGRTLLSEMAAVGLDVRYVERVQGAATLFSFCFVYPDGSGGNLTTADSAASRVDPAYVLRAEPDFQRYRGRGIALAVPEAPLEARYALLRLGSQYDFFRVASFTTGEIAAALGSGILDHVDLLALNRDEAAAAAGPAHDAVRGALAALTARNPALRLSITAGREGSWIWDGSWHHLAALQVPVAGTSGAGDAHLAGVIAGLVEGMPLAEAHQLGNVAAAASITSPHTIHPALDRDFLRRFAACETTGKP
jgi:ribokinase